MKTPFSKTLERLRAGAADIAKELERVRLDRIANITEADQLRNLAVSDEEIAGRIDKYLSSEETFARTYYDPSGFTEPLNSGRAVNTETAFQRHPDGLMCAIGLREQIRAAMFADAKRSIPGGQISPKDRAAKIEALAAELRALDLAEESLVRACEECGLTVHRRADADPAIFLLEEL